mgnify:CR=1 FL=1
MKYVLGGETYTSKAAIEVRCRAILGPHPRREYTLEGADLEFTRSLFEVQEHGPSVHALEMAFGRLLPGGCHRPPPTDLIERARMLQNEAFGRAEPVVLPADYPPSLPVVR